MALTQVRPEGLGFVNGKRNLIINGAMQVAQRGTSATTYSNSGGFGAADRISFRRGGTWTTTTFDLSQEDTSGLDEFPKCSQIKVQDAVANPNANDGTFCNFRYALEGNEIQHLQYGTSNAKDVTLSFYIKSPVTGTYCVHFEINHAAANYVAEYTINSANTWEYKTITVPAPSTSELGTKPTNDNNIQLAIYWILSGNTTGTSTARGSAGWSGTEPDRTRYTVNQANAFSTLNNAVQLTGCQLEVGTNASDFEHESYAETLQKCRRYFIGVGNIYSDFWGSTGTQMVGVHIGAHQNNAFMPINVLNPTKMRATPTAAINGTPKFTDFASNRNNITGVAIDSLHLIHFTYDGSQRTANEGIGINLGDGGVGLSLSAEL